MGTIRITGPKHTLDECDLVVDGPRAILASNRVELEVIKPTDPSHPSLHVLGTAMLTPEAADRLALQLIRAAERARQRGRDFEKVREQLIADGVAKRGDFTGAAEERVRAAARDATSGS